MRENERGGLFVREVVGFVAMRAYPEKGRSVEFLTAPSKGTPQAREWRSSRQRAFTSFVVDRGTIPAGTNPVDRDNREDMS